jgi:hypothetical protein
MACFIFFHFFPSWPRSRQLIPAQSRPRPNSTRLPPPAVPAPQPPDCSAARWRLVAPCRIPFLFPFRCCLVSHHYNGRSHSKSTTVRSPPLTSRLTTLSSKRARWASLLHAAPESPVIPPLSSLKALCRWALLTVIFLHCRWPSSPLPSPRWNYRKVSCIALLLLEHSQQAFPHPTGREHELRWAPWPLMAAGPPWTDPAPWLTSGGPSPWLILFKNKSRNSRYSPNLCKLGPVTSNPYNFSTIAPI